ncbi:DEAD/DEAH box helicase [Geothermobacter hydrogeniphilus]|uniref:DEAD-box ATP-dependent RNA helicase RhpA n=1 Tax=Geothermobacter hydrogeniphilus TaxID=1969733 RepID=A0A1X0Y0H4_9BACT|nr:DEAD/DEAH box helicase [Geothermobacter hydrogeniphilus]ORJ58572.1 RNA helicase [Geothermobacter hydrogeniphilus]
MNFSSFNLHPKINAGITAAGYSTPTPIQAQAIPKIMRQRDVMGLAQTGTGKTAAFGLPILHRLLTEPRGGVRALVIAPTRELAEQIHESLSQLGNRSGLRSTTIYGGVGINPQIARLKKGVDIVVACPGRLLDHIQQGTIDLRRLQMLVLDEADQMFDMGFLPDIRRIIKALPVQRQTLLFSATMPKEIRHLAEEVLTDPERVQVDIVAPAETVSHALYPVPQHLKTNLLLKLLQQTNTESVLVFTRTKHRAKRLGEKLGKSGYRAASLQGNLSQNKRQAALNGFRDGSVQILVATDIAARGIDVSQVSHVINFDIPNTTEAYIHRIGRTGRASRSGDAFTLITEEDRAMVRAIEKVLGQQVEQRTLENFDYRLPAPARTGQSPRSAKPVQARKNGIPTGNGSLPQPARRRPRRRAANRVGTL